MLRCEVYSKPGPYICHACGNAVLAARPSTKTDLKASNGAEEERTSSSHQATLAPSEEAGPVYKINACTHPECPA